MKPNIIFLFPGQGGQYKGMGKQLFQTNQYFASSLESSDSIFQKHVGYSLIDALYGNSQDELNDLIFSTPAILSLEIAMLNTLNAFGIQPDYVVGNSIGEVAATVACGMLPKEVAIEIVIEHSKSIVQSSMGEGGMITVININYDKLMSLLSKYELYIASFNCPNNYTISGFKTELDAFQLELKAKNILYYRLPIAYPFHSPLINQSKDDYRYYIATSNLSLVPNKRFISGLYGQKTATLPEDYFWKVISEQMNIPQLVANLEEKGPNIYIDLGPSGTMANFVKYNLTKSSKSIVHPIMTPFKTDLKQLKKLQELL